MPVYPKPKALHNKKTANNVNAPNALIEPQSVSVAILDFDSEAGKFLSIVRRMPFIHRVTTHRSPDSIHAPPDIIIVSYAAADMQKIQRIRAIGEMFPHAAVVIITPESEPQRILAALAAGARGYLLMPLRAAHLNAAIREIAGGGAVLSPFVVLTVVQSLWRSASQTEKVLALLSPREQEVMRFLVQGLSYNEIAERLSIRRGTVQRHLHGIYAKLRVRNRAEAAHRFQSG